MYKNKYNLTAAKRNKTEKILIRCFILRLNSLKPKVYTKSFDFKTAKNNVTDLNTITAKQIMDEHFWIIL